MEKSCENCRYTPRTHGCISGITYIDFSQHKPDYPTLERENAELKQQLIVLSAEWNGQHEKRRKAQLQAAQLDQALERSREWLAQTIVGDSCRHCIICPLCGTDQCLYKTGVCSLENLKTALMKHFKEGT